MSRAGARTLAGLSLLILALGGMVPSILRAQEPGVPGQRPLEAATRPIETESRGVATDNPVARGVIRALHRTVLSSELAGRIEAMPFRAGEQFPAGALLVRLDCRLFVAQRDQIEAALAGARQTLASHRQLERLDSISKLEVALAEATVAEREAERRIADLNVERCQLRAPWAGRVVARMAEPHQSVRPQQELIEIVGNRGLEAELVAPGGWASHLTAGAPLRLLVDELGTEVDLTIVALGAVIDPASQTRIVRARIDHPPPALVPGMSGSARTIAP